MAYLTKVPLVIDAPPTILAVVGIDRFEGVNGPAVTFEGATHAVSMSASTAERQMERHGLTPEQAVGQTFRFQKVKGGKSGYINIDPVADVAPGTLTAGLTPPAPAAPEGYAGPMLPGETLPAPATVAAVRNVAEHVAADFATREREVFVAAGKALRASAKLHAALYAEDSRDAGYSNAVARFAGCLLIQLDKDRLVHPPIAAPAPRPAATDPMGDRAPAAPKAGGVDVAALKAMVAAVPAKREEPVVRTPVAKPSPMGRGTSMDAEFRQPMPPAPPPPDDDEFADFFNEAFDPEEQTR